MLPKHNGHLIPNPFWQWSIALVLVGGAVALAILNREVPAWLQTLVALAAGFWLRGQFGQEKE